MKAWTKLGVFLVFLCLFGLGAVLLFWETGAECVSILRAGTGRGEYLLTAADGSKNIYALGRRDGGYRLVIGDEAGRRTGVWKLNGEVLPQDSRPALLYPAAGGAVYLGLYAIEDGETTLRLYRVAEEGRTVELLLSEPCRGDSLPEQMAEVRLSDFSEVDSVVTFAVMRGDTAEFYRRTSAESGLEELETVTQPGLRSALALSDRTLALAAGDRLVRTDREPVELTGDEIIIQMSQAGTGIYYVDGAGLNVFFADFADWRPYAYLSLEKDAYDLDELTDLGLTRDGDALLLMDGRRLLLDRGSGVSDLSGMLYRPAWQCGLILAGLALGVLLLAFTLWYLMCEWHRLHIPMLLRWGAVAAAVALLGVGGILRGAVGPACQAAAEREAVSMLGGVSAVQLDHTGIEDPELPRLLAGDMAGAAGQLYWDTASEVYRRDGDGVWTIAAGNTGLPSGVRAELSAAFDREQAEQALGGGYARWTRWDGDGARYIVYRAQGDCVLSAGVDGGGLLEAAGVNYRWMVLALWALCAQLVAVIVLLLCWVTAGIFRILKGMERLAAGERGVEIRLNSGDELESLAGDVNALSRAMGELEEGRHELARSYRRFVPERVLALLGTDDIAQVGKHTFTSRRLAAMMLSFRFPQEVYDASGKDLFDHVNEIIERTASIVTAKGGVVFNFAYDGYDAVFEGGSAAAVSTAVAVQQAVLEVNREREERGQPRVSVRVALDEGDVMLGLVGDENQMEPASISSSFSVARHLIELGERLEASILCTETVMRGIEGYASRYIGKCGQTEPRFRIYEIFDGDAYEIRKAKERTGEEFSQGVYALYSQELSKAKSIFLSLIRRGAGDGGARYYLYLADWLEKHPGEDISLDSAVWDEKRGMPS